MEDQNVCSNIDSDMVTVNTKEIEDFIADNTDLPYFVTGGRKTVVRHLVILFSLQKLSCIKLKNCILTFLSIGSRKLEMARWI